MTTISPQTQDPSMLTNVVFEALRTRHAHLAEREGGALRYLDAVAPFAAVPAQPSEQDWRDLATLAHRTGGAALHREPGALPAGWAAEHDLEPHRMTVLQFSGAGFAAADDAEVRELTPADVPAMRALADLTKPGPFRERTIEFGGYLGLWRDGVLAAMAGRRFSAPPGWTEISAVCTDPAFRGQGLATRLMRAVAARIRADGDEVFLHVIATNTGAIALYERLGFTRLATVEVTVLTPSGTDGGFLH
ncbi:GNAT family N-acetyltransferase [Amycolatopsis rhabdoformis]|uniref:GNAT family N-acetyltransferase n=1 Tax=Amycolatopsis rhabdoformis TaxID=1448059 RepID=A0ABZ1I647_9PSEU|nr:GNAT family N-acetyltransferase [Amycolatopsis rhabdoformis]WSE29896.1 GNAT family N-acetyltransferase [Amycolatopsis rhabdoformis]